jgi:ribosomal protein S14
MTIRFAAPQHRYVPRMSRRRMREASGAAANDNDESSDALLHAALRHFAEHGLAAASRASKQAETALLAGDRQAYLSWLEICRVLDRRMAGEIELRAHV